MNNKNESELPPSYDESSQPQVQFVQLQGLPTQPAIQHIQAQPVIQSQQQQYYAQTQLPIITPLIQQQSIVTIEFLREECDICVDCWMCCCFLWTLPQPQPRSNNSYEILCDDIIIGTIRQGETISVNMNSGIHQIELRIVVDTISGAIGGVFKSIAGNTNDMKTNGTMIIEPNQVAQYIIGFYLDKCGDRDKKTLQFGKKP